MDEVKRQAQEHQMWELEWETAFNIQLRIKETISFMLAWAASDVSSAMIIEFRRKKLNEK